MRSYCWLFLRLWKGCLTGSVCSVRGFGLKRLAVMAVFLPVFLAVQTIHWVGLLLDEILFAGYRRTEVREPVFIVGIPRSGTTLLHRVLARDSQRFTTFALWELLFAPSVTQRKLCLAVAAADGWLGGPLRKCIDWMQRAVFGRLDAIHRVSLSDPEEDYFTLLPALACFLLILPFPASRMLWQLTRFDDDLSSAERRHIMAFYRSCLQRHLYVHGADKTLLSKNPSFCSMVGALRETFPDCRVISTVRSPLRAVPSQLSSMRLGLLMFNGERAWSDFQERLVAMLAHYYKHLASTLATWPEDRHVFVPMGELTADVRKTVAKIYERFGMNVSSEYRGSLDAAYEEARSYKSVHEYTLEEFDLDVRTIGEEFSHAFDYFGFEPVSKACGASP
jgi:hypothetical protein